MKWKKLNSKYLLKTPWATLRVDECELPDGRIMPNYYVLEYPDWVNGVGLTKEGEIVMIRQYRHGGELVSLELPGGCIEENESPEQAIEREMLEETGYRFDTFKQLSVLYPNPATSNNKTYCFIATGGEKVKAQNLDPHEDIEIVILSLEEVEKLLENNKIPQSLHVSGLFYALQYLKQKL